MTSPHLSLALGEAYRAELRRQAELYRGSRPGQPGRLVATSAPGYEAPSFGSATPYAGRLQPRSRWPLPWARLESRMHVSKPLTPPAEPAGTNARQPALTGESGSTRHIGHPNHPHQLAAGVAPRVITAYVIAFASLLVTAGRMADRVGRRRALFAGVGVFAAGSALTALAPSVPLVVSGRVIQGVGAALLLPSSLGLLLAASLPATRAQTVALWGGAAALALLAGRKWVPPDPQPALFGGADYGGVVLMSMALAGLVLTISEAPDWGWSD